MNFFKVKDIPSPKAEKDSLYRGRMWGPLSWGHDEFSSWFGVNLPWVEFPSSLANRFALFDRTILNEGFYGFYHHHS